jgi:hypothetical protein
LVFSAILSDAHPLVVPMMIDQIGIRPGNHCRAHAHGNPLRVNTKRFATSLSASKPSKPSAACAPYEAVELLRQLAAKREGLTFVEPAGLRASAEDGFGHDGRKSRLRKSARRF